MAERYGTIPKRFTAEWFGYIWTYYKWWIIAPVAIIVIITGLLYSIYKISQVDLILTYAGPYYFHGGQVEAIQTQFAKDCPDVNGDGEKKLSFSSLTISTDDTDFEYKSSMITTLQFALYEEEKYIFIIHKDFAPRFFTQQDRNCAYASVNSWLTVEANNKERLSVRGIDYGVSLEGSKLFEKYGADLKDHYLFIRKQPESKDEQKAYKAAIKMANELLGKK